MNNKYYSSERNVQILLALLKRNGIKKVIVSPGGTNICFVGSIQNDPFFEIYSSVDERSAAYMACGLAAESGEPVVLSCTMSTASRNYYPGMTEAYYRKLPVLAITSHIGSNHIGNLRSQVIDRRIIPNDVAQMSVELPIPKDESEDFFVEMEVNRAILALKNFGSGPVHINLITTCNQDFTIKELPLVQTIRRYQAWDQLPEIPQGKVGVFVGVHRKFTESQVSAIERFCATHDAVVICDHTSGYYGEYRLQPTLVQLQKNAESPLDVLDLMIHIGETSAATFAGTIQTKNIWRVSEDGEVRNPFKKLSKIFQMSEEMFFTAYSKRGADKHDFIDACREKCYAIYEQIPELPFSNIWRVSEDGEVRNPFKKLSKIFQMSEEMFFTAYSKRGADKHDFIDACREKCYAIYEQIPELPFSNIWTAMQLSSRLPEKSLLHISASNTRRCWNIFPLPETVESSCNVGCCGIDGCTSTLIGASLVNPKRLCYLVTGDLAFFYDINVLGNRHVGNNVRILLINNGVGTEFKMNSHNSYMAFKEDVNEYMAAEGHFGRKSPCLVKHFAEDLGFEYLTASTKNEFMQALDKFTNPSLSDKPIIFEVFTDAELEREALEIMTTLDYDAKTLATHKLKETAKSVLGKNLINTIRKFSK